MVVERSRASYLIGALGMLKVEGSNPACSVLFRAKEVEQELELIRDLFANQFAAIFGISIEVDVLGRLRC